MTEFTKYRIVGAYHWSELSRHPTQGHPYTRSRVEWVLRQAPQARRVLEVGCGDAAVIGRFAGRGATVVGVERDDTGRELAEQQFRAHGLAGSFHRELSEIEGQRFDVVVLAEVIEHVDDPRGLLAACCRHLEPGGALLLTTPIRKTEVVNPFHVQEFWPGEFRALLGSYFDDVRIDLFQASWLVDLLSLQLLRRCPVRVLLNLVRALTGVELLDRATSPGGLYWTQGAVCRRPRA